MLALILEFRLWHFLPGPPAPSRSSQRRCVRPERAVVRPRTRPGFAERWVCAPGSGLSLSRIPHPRTWRRAAGLKPGRLVALEPGVRDLGLAGEIPFFARQGRVWTVEHPQQGTLLLLLPVQSLS